MKLETLIVGTCIPLSGHVQYGCHSAYSFFLPHFPKDVPNGAMTQRAPPTMLPRVTGMRFLKNICETVISAPRRMPNGMMNMLATLYIYGKRNEIG
jgi:hypothetical protein